MYRTQRTVSHSGLRGVDFSRPPSLVDKNRSPYCLNMMPDNSLDPVKRPGWETVYTVGGKVHNIWFCTVDDVEYMLCHSGDKIYLLGDEPTVLISGITDGDGCGFYAADKDKSYFYILTSGEYLRFDGEKIEPVSKYGYVPLVAIAKTPAGGGESYEDINMLSPKRRESFVGTDTDFVYQLGADNIDRVDKVEIMAEDGSYTQLEAVQDYTADTTLGKIIFVQTHPTPLTGHDNIVVTYSKTVEGYADKIEKCTIAGKFGLGGENRIFLSGNKSCAQTDFWSDVYNPCYFPDLNYAIIGGGQTAVMGYLKMGGYMGIVKEGNGQDTTLFLRSAEQTQEGRALFTIRAGVSEIGAISKRCFATLGDEPVFLSSRGVFGVVSGLIDSEKMIVNRSAQLDGALLAENNLQDAVACVWKDFYFLAVNGNCYLLDSRQIVPAKNGEKNSRYEGYFWNNVDAKCLAVQGDRLWFGTGDGVIRRLRREDDTHCYADGDSPIHAVWRTPVDDEGCVERFKTLMRRGCLVTLKPFIKSSCTVYFCVDGGEKQFVCKVYTDITTAFERLDFGRFTFNNSRNPQEIYFYKREKRYKRIQLIFENNELNEGFGIQEIIKTYKITGNSKNRRY